MKTKMEVKDKNTGEVSLVDYVVTKDEVPPLSCLDRSVFIFYNLLVQSPQYHFGRSPKAFTSPL
jgi:hypothetical protein